MWQSTRTSLLRPLTFTLTHPIILRKQQILQRTSSRCCTTQPTSKNPPRQTPSQENGTPPKFHIESETITYQRYQTVYSRRVRYPSGKTIDFDVLGNPRSSFQSVFIFPFDTQTQTATLLREYSPGPHCIQWGFPAGMFEESKHGSLEEAARAELSEEAHLKGGKLVRLMDGGGEGMGMGMGSGGLFQDKYSRNLFNLFLGMDCVEDEMPGGLDEEEWIGIERGVSLGMVRNLIAEGEMNMPSAFLGMMALDRLRGMGFESG